jgi:SAM-dependent methyltransferase
MKEVSCNFCGQREAEPLNSGPDMLTNSGRFFLTRCRNCGLIYQNPQLEPEELAAHYPPEYPRFVRERETGSPLTRLSERHALSRQRQRLERRIKGPGKLLDVGCATGQFLNHMRGAGWDVIGVEFSEYAARYGRETYNIDIKHGTLETAGFTDNEFDVVTLWDVLEHVPNPKATLQEVVRILKPGGLLAASTPNPDSIEARLFGPHWIGWERPRHLHLFPPELLRCYLAEAGLKEVDFESFGGRLAVTLISVEYWLKTTQLPEDFWRPCLRLAYRWPLRLATWPIYRMAELVNKTTTITVFARV